jgi:hypothetical protein
MRLGLLAALGLACGCANPYIWVPTERSNSKLAESGLPAANYAVPTVAPRGSVEVGTLGTKHMPQLGDRKAVVVRMIVTNNGDVPWKVDVRNQMLTFATGLRVAPDLAYASKLEPPPELTVPPRDRVSIDLLYVVPSGGKPLEHFELAWSVDMQREVSSDRTDFRRVNTEPPVWAWGYGTDFAAYGYYPPPWYYPAPFYSYGIGFGPYIAGPVIPRVPTPPKPRLEPNPVYVPPQPPESTGH